MVLTFPWLLHRLLPIPLAQDTVSCTYSVPNFSIKSICSTNHCWLTGTISPLPKVSYSWYCQIPPKVLKSSSLFPKVENSFRVSKLQYSEWRQLPLNPFYKLVIQFNQFIISLLKPVHNAAGNFHHLYLFLYFKNEFGIHCFLHLMGSCILQRI